MHRKLLILVLASVLASCGPRHLERGGVPIFYGMRLDESSDEWELPANLGYLTAGDADGLLIELPVQADSAGFPRVSYLPSQRSIALLKESGISLSVAFATSNRDELFPPDRPFNDRADKWVLRLSEALRAAIDTFADCKLDRVVLSRELGSMTSPGYNNHELLRGLRMHHSGPLYSFGGRSEDLQMDDMLLVSDEIVIDYPPVAGEELKNPCRQENLKITDLAHQTGRAVFIYRANVIAYDPVLQIKNRLRFWSDEVRLSGLCLNTLYPKIPPLDAKTYYGLADNPDVAIFLDEYQQRGPF